MAHWNSLVDLFVVLILTICGLIMLSLHVLEYSSRAKFQNHCTLPIYP